jgi:hypothetical protein
MTTRGGAWAVLIVAFVASCERDPESLRSQLTAKQAAWERQVSSLRALQSSMQERFERQPPPAVALVGGVSAPHQRVRAILDGSRQSLADLHLQIRQAGSRLEPEITRGGEASEHALDAEATRIGALLQQLSGQLTSVAQELEGLASKGETK